MWQIRACHVNAENVRATYPMLSSQWLKKIRNRETAQTAIIIPWYDCQKKWSEEKKNNKKCNKTKIILKLYK